MYCKNCGNELGEDNKFCAKCGAKVKQNAKKVEKQHKEEKNKKETSKGLRIFIVILLSILCIYFSVMLIISVPKTFTKLFNGSTSMLPGFFCSLALYVLIIYGLIKNIQKIRGKEQKELTPEQLQARKKKVTIFSILGVILFVFIIAIMFAVSYFSGNAKKQEAINKIREYQDKGYFNWTEENYQELEQYSKDEVEETLNKIENYLNLCDKYNENFGEQLDEIFGKELKVELYQSEDRNYVYVPFNTATGESHQKAQVEYVVIDKSSNKIYEIYYSVEMNLTVYNKYNGKVVSNSITKKYYKIPYLSEIDEVKKINNYNDQAIREEIDIALRGTSIVAKPSTNKNYKYEFTNIEK